MDIEHENVMSPQGQQIDFVKSDENSRKWLNEFRTKPFSVPGKLENVDGEHFKLYKLILFQLNAKYVAAELWKTDNIRLEMHLTDFILI